VLSLRPAEQHPGDDPVAEQDQHHRPQELAQQVVHAAPRYAAGNAAYYPRPDGPRQAATGPVILRGVDTAGRSGKRRAGPHPPRAVAMTHTLLPLAAVVILAGAAAAQDPSPVAPGAKLELLADGFKFTEGPSVD